jgi:hypothetical protein
MELNTKLGHKNLINITYVPKINIWYNLFYKLHDSININYVLKIQIGFFYWIYEYNLFN